MYFGALIGFANTILLYPKILPKEEFGLVQLIVSISMLMAAISTFGTPNALVRYFPHFRNNQSKSNSGLVRFLLLISGVVTLILLALLILLRGLVFDAYEVSAPLLLDYYYYILPVFFFQVFINMLTSYLNVIRKSHIQVIQKEILIRLGQTVLIVLYHFDLVSIEVFVPLFVSLFAMSLLYLLGYLYWAGEINFNSDRLPKKGRKEVWQFSVFTFLSGIARQISFRIDSIMVGSLVVSAVMVGALLDTDGVINRGLEAVSIYAVALNMSSMLEMPFRALNQSLAPSISHAWATKDHSKVYELYKKSTETMMVVGVFVAVGIWVCVDQILEILPSNYAEVKYVLGWLLLGKLLNVVAGANGVVMMNSPKYKILTYLSFFGLILTVTTNYVFIRYYQIEGAAMATFLTYSVLNIIIWFLILKFYKMQPFGWRNLVTAMLGVGLIVLASMVTVSEEWIDSWLRVLIGAVIVALSFLIYLQKSMRLVLKMVIASIILALGYLMFMKIDVPEYVVVLILKSILVTAVFWGIIYFGKLSPEINKLIDNRILSRIGK